MEDLARLDRMTSRTTKVAIGVTDFAPDHAASASAYSC